MLKVVILAFLVNGCISFYVEEYKVAWKDLFDGYPSNDLFPKMGDYRADMYMNALVRTKGNNGLEFALQTHSGPGSIKGRLFRFAAPGGVDIRLTSLLFEFLNNDQCKLHLTFKSEKQTPVEWKITSPVYTPPAPKTEAQDHASSFAVKPKYFGMEIISRISRHFRETTLDILWIEKILEERPKCIGGTPLKKECAGVAVIMPRNLLKAMHAKIGELLSYDSIQPNNTFG